MYNPTKLIQRVAILLYIKKSRIKVLTINIVMYLLTFFGILHDFFQHVLQVVLFYRAFIRWTAILFKRVFFRITAFFYSSVMERKKKINVENDNYLTSWLFIDQNLFF